MEMASSTNARRSERQVRSLEVLLIGKARGFEYQEPAHTVDISEGGLGIMTDNAVDASRPMTTGQIVYVLGSGEQSLGFYRVVWARAQNERSHTRAGLQFLN